MSTDYILVTPAKNEEENLPYVAGTIIRQTVKPSLWVIVDDGSTDKTPDIIDTLAEDYDWIKTVRLPPHPRDITFHYAYVCVRGLDSALQYCRDNNIDYEYIGLLDADTELEEEYFEKLMLAFEENNGLGIASGSIYLRIKEKLQWEKKSLSLPAGTGRLWSKECFLKTGGYAIEPCPDAISNVKAIIKGWQIRQYKSIVAIQRRATFSEEGFWQRYIINGRTAYYLNKHPLLAVLQALFLTSQKPFFGGLPYLYGYFMAMCKREKQIIDEEIKDYYWKRRLKDIFKISKFS